jgi:hypothetical protein
VTCLQLGNLCVVPALGTYSASIMHRLEPLTSVITYPCSVHNRASFQFVALISQERKIRSKNK